MNEEYLVVKGMKIYIKILGHGKPLIFLHGGPGAEHRYFLPHIKRLSEQYQLIFYDQRGCGKSEECPNPTDYTITGEVETLEALRVMLGVQKLNLIGESWGTMLALLYATQYPENVNKIFLTAAVGLKGEDYLDFGRKLEERLTPAEKEKLSKLEVGIKNGVGDVKDIFNIIDRYYVWNPETIKRKTPTRTNSIVNQYMGNDIIKNYDITSSVGKLQNIPIWIAQGNQDIMNPLALNHSLLKFIPHAKLWVINECGHWTIVEKPDQVVSLISIFFDDNIYEFLLEKPSVDH